MILKLLSSLEKVFPCKEPSAAPYTAASCLLGEIFSFQLAIYTDKEQPGSTTVRVLSDLGEKISLCAVKYVPTTFPAYHLRKDDNYITEEPGIFPDLLQPIDNELTLVCGQWRTLWVQVQGTTPGTHPITLVVGEEQVVFTLDILSIALPKQELIFTQWFHCDSLADYYKVPVFSEEHWRLLDLYMGNAAKYGMNMILTPVLTPPLDTQVGGERTTVQLVDIAIEHGEYHFSYEKLDRYITLAQSHGFWNFEISHPFTQWGARFAPKVVATKNGKLQKIFGWETAATSAPYIAFIRSFLFALKAHLQTLGVFENSYFHVSDEPGEEQLESYRAALNIVRDIYEDCKVIDALSDYSFYQLGLVKHPIPSNDHITPFLENGVTPLWTYYCCGQSIDVSNRFLAMPSARNRIIGHQFFKYDIAGFLQWGYNFWYNQYARHLIDPLAVTDAEEAFPGGDAFSVYPSPDGTPLASLRQVVFNEALQDLRAMKLLSAYSSKEEVLALCSTIDSGELTFSNYPQNPEFLLRTRELINKELLKYGKSS